MLIPLLIIITIILNGIFAMMSANIRRDKKIEDTAYLYLISIQWLTMLVQFIGIALALYYFIPKSPLDPKITSIIIIILAIYIYILFGDRIPKKVFHQYIDRNWMPMIQYIHTLMTPLTFFLRIRIEPKQEDYSKEDIREMLNAGDMEEPQKEFIENLFEFDDTPVEEICTHRSEVICLYLEDDTNEWKKVIHENRHTFYPVCDKDNDDVVGILDTRDYFRLDSIQQENVINKAMDRPFFVSQNMKADELLKEMKKRRVYFAVLIDEYGGMSGIVTLHDLIETLLGEIQEEDDIDEPEPIQQLDPVQWRIYGFADIEDVEKALHIDLPEEEYDTFGGYVLGCYKHIPDDGTTFDVHLEEMDIYVKEIKNHRIGQMIVQVHTKEEEVKDESTEKRNRN